MKSYADYLVGDECGLVVKAKYIDGIPAPPTDAMKLGQYFEFVATGGLPAYGDGTPPEADVVYKGKPNEKLAAPYERAFASATYFKAMANALGIKILEAGKPLFSEKHNLSGTADIWAEWNGTECIIDLKYSGLVDNKWDDLGWHQDFLDQKDKLLAQPVHYKLMAEEMVGKPVPFYFFVFNSQDPNDVRIFEIEIEPTRSEMHLQAAKNTLERIINESENDSWKARPSLKRCNKCHIADTCQFRAVVPDVVKIFY